MENLDYLLVHDNLLRGTIPQQIRAHSVIALHQNELYGTIPEDLGIQNPRLEQLWLHSNYLRGSIPDSLASLTNLQSLLLHQNNLIGSMPAGICAILAISGELQNVTADCRQVYCSCCTNCSYDDEDSNNTAPTAPPSFDTNGLQRRILMDFFLATNGEVWTRSDGWLNAPDECGWYGVRCDDNGAVTAIDLGKSRSDGIGV
jgi:hypothetical protein